MTWAILHHRLEAGLGDALRRRWRRAWPPGPLGLIALLVASGLSIGRYPAPTTAKVLPVALVVLALVTIVVGSWRTQLALPRWLGGHRPSAPVIPS